MAVTAVVLQVSAAGCHDSMAALTTLPLVPNHGWRYDDGRGIGMGTL